MKTVFPVYKSANKLPHLSLYAVLIVFSALVGFCSVYFSADIIRQGGYAALVLLALLALIQFAFATLLLVLCFSKVQLSETGVVLRFGNIKLREIKWENVKRTEKVVINSGVCIINVMAKDTPSFSFRKKLVIGNLNKKRITFEFESEAMDIISSRCDCGVVCSSSE